MAYYFKISDEDYLKSPHYKSVIEAFPYFKFSHFEDDGLLVLKDEAGVECILLTHDGAYPTSKASYIASRNAFIKRQEASRSKID